MLTIRFTNNSFWGQGLSTATEKINKEISVKSKKLVQDEIKKFSDKDIKAIADSCNKLRSLDNKKNESRREFVKIFEEHHDTYRMVINTFKELTLNTVNNGDSKKTILAYYVQLIRNRQEEVGLSKNLLNEVKFGFMKSIVKWVDSPSELDKIVSTKHVEKSEIKKDFSSGSTGLSLELISKKKTPKYWELKVKLTNASKYPLQNIFLSFIDNKNKKLQIIEASGEIISIDTQKNMALIPFIVASMDENIHKTVEYSIKGSLDENFENLTAIEVKIDNPVKKIKETLQYDVKK